MKIYRHPDVEELAKLAAIVSADTKRSPSDAVAYALELWRESHAVIERMASEEAGISGYGPFERTLDQIEAVQQKQTALKASRATLPMPPQFPATLEEFIRLVVRAKTPADSTKRLRDFFRDSYKGKETDLDTAAADEFQKIKEGDRTGGFFTKQKWQLLAIQFKAWWRQHRSTIASKSARRRKKKLAR